MVWCGRYSRAGVVCPLWVSYTQSVDCVCLSWRVRWSSVTGLRAEVLPMALCLGFHMQIHTCTLQSRIQHRQYHQPSSYPTTARLNKEVFSRQCQDCTDSARMEDFASDTDSDYTSYWRDWVGPFHASRAFHSLLLLLGSWEGTRRWPGWVSCPLTPERTKRSLAIWSHISNICPESDYGRLFQVATVRIHTHDEHPRALPLSGESPGIPSHARTQSDDFRGCRKQLGCRGTLMTRANQRISSYRPEEMSTSARSTKTTLRTAST